jgi:hypothetical protein
VFRLTTVGASRERWPERGEQSGPHLRHTGWIGVNEVLMMSGRLDDFVVTVMWYGVHSSRGS